MHICIGLIFSFGFFFFFFHLVEWEGFKKITSCYYTLSRNKNGPRRTHETTLWFCCLELKYQVQTTLRKTIIQKYLHMIISCLNKNLRLTKLHANYKLVRRIMMKCLEYLERYMRLASILYFDSTSDLLTRLI